MAKLPIIEARQPVVYRSLQALEALPVEVSLIQAVQRINERICASTNLDLLLDGVVMELGSLLKADRVHLALRDTASGGFGFIGHEWLSSSNYPATLGALLPSEHDDEVVMDLVATAPPLAIVDPLSDLHLPAGPRRVFTAMAVQSAMAGRLQFQGKVLGVICIHQCAYVRPWSEQEATFFTLVLGQVSVAIANARMLRSLQAHHQELIALHFKLDGSHKALERQVADRTGDLQAANVKLTHMIQELGRVARHRNAFIATVTHELRTPLTLIKGFGTLMRAGACGKLPRAAQGALENILEGAERMIALVNNLLDHGQLEQGRLSVKPEPFDYLPTLQHLSTEFAPLLNPKGQTFKAELPSTLPPVLADEVRVRQVLTNLIANAIKFTPAHGFITVRAIARPEALITEVTDTGIGIPTSEQTRIFEPFQQLTLHAGGTGLGLSIAQSLVAAMGGSLELESQPGFGSTFRFSLPWARV
jgi:signal transduction histidine kinase